jgi:F420-dependent oxidoreductase-like protein
MRFALMTEPQQGLKYEEIVELARTAEEAGLETFFRSDHYASFPGEEGLSTTDAWATLAGLARETTRIGLGSLVSPVTFRLPGNFAKLVTTVDEMSGGRVEVGVGAGWNELEHAQHGLPFPGIGQRFDMLEESLAILHGLWSEPHGWSFEGDHWQVSGARLVPRPVSRDGRRHPNIIVGGEGKPRSARLAARFADEYNVVSARPERAREVFARVAEACDAIGRDPEQVTRSAMTGVLIADSEVDLRERVREQLAMFGEGGTDDAEGWLAQRRERWIMGSRDQALERVDALAGAGVQRIMLQDFLPRDLDMVRLMGRYFVS